MRTKRGAQPPPAVVFDALVEHISRTFPERALETARGARALPNPISRPCYWSSRREPARFNWSELMFAPTEPGRSRSPNCRFWPISSIFHWNGEFSDWKSHDSGGNCHFSGSPHDNSSPRPAGSPPLKPVLTGSGTIPNGRQTLPTGTEAIPVGRKTITLES